MLKAVISWVIFGRWLDIFNRLCVLLYMRQIKSMNTTLPEIAGLTDRMQSNVPTVIESATEQQSV